MPSCFVQQMSQQQPLQLLCVCALMVQQVSRSKVQGTCTHHVYDSDMCVPLCCMQIVLAVLLALVACCLATAVPLGIPRKLTQTSSSATTVNIIAAPMTKDGSIDCLRVAASPLCVSVRMLPNASQTFLRLHAATRTTVSSWTKTSLLMPGALTMVPAALLLPERQLALSAVSCVATHSCPRSKGHLVDNKALLSFVQKAPSNAHDT